LKPGKTYKFSIVSHSSDSKTTKTAKVTVKTKTYVTPKGIKKASTNDSITLTWKNSPFAETDRYEVICYASKGKTVIYPADDPNIVIAPGTAGRMSATISGLDSNTKYKFEIRAISDLLNIQSKPAKTSVKTKK
jgi:hypothetical protein